MLIAIALPCYNLASAKLSDMSFREAALVQSKSFAATAQQAVLRYSTAYNKETIMMNHRDIDPSPDPFRRQVRSGYISWPREVTLLSKLDVYPRYITRKAR